jgi:hypothetical protein
MGKPPVGFQNSVLGSLRGEVVLVDEAAEDRTAHDLGC